MDGGDEANQMMEQAKLKKKKARPSSDDDGPSKRPKASTDAKKRLPPHKYILAPMVGGSELAFRLLCRRYATKELLCYTPMINSVRFASEEAYRVEAFQTCKEDRPLVAHFCGNDPQTLLAAARFVEHRCDAVDLNLGCPQRIAHSGHFGSYLLDEVDRPLVCDIVRTLSKNLAVPVFVKIRLLENTEKTVELCCQLRDAGASLIAVHARHRVNLVGRSGPGARDGAALLGEVTTICERVPNVRIVSNGNVITFDDVRDNLRSTRAHGIMSAEGMLDDPALFLPTAAGGDALGAAAGGGGDSGGGGGLLGEDSATAAVREVRKIRKKLREIDRLETKDASGLSAEEKEKIATRAALMKQLKKLKKSHPLAAEAADAAAPAAPKPAPSLPAAAAQHHQQKKPSPLTLAVEYCELAERYNVPMKTILFHVRRMAKAPLTEYQLLAPILEAADLPAVRAVIDRAKHYEVHGYTPDPEQARREKEALELKKWREQTRKRFEERMIRKAKREGKAEEYYLLQGAEAPTASGIAALKAMAPDAAFAEWKRRHGQHCWALHMEGECTRERTCAFLHADVSADAKAKADEPQWHG